MWLDWNWVFNSQFQFIKNKKVCMYYLTNTALAIKEAMK